MPICAIGSIYGGLIVGKVGMALMEKKNSRTLTGTEMPHLSLLIYPINIRIVCETHLQCDQRPPRRQWTQPH